MLKGAVHRLAQATDALDYQRMIVGRRHLTEAIADYEKSLAQIDRSSRSANAYYRSGTMLLTMGRWYLAKSTNLLRKSLRCASGEKP